MSVVKTLIILNVLIFVHELGHYVAARLAGVHVNEFAIGFGPAIFSFMRNNTTYSLRLVPLGGFCSLQGMEEKDDEVNEEGNFLDKPILWRMFIIVAGPLMNLITAIVIFIILILVFFRAPIGVAIVGSLQEFWYILQIIFVALRDIFVVGTAELTGPVGVVNIVGEVAQTYDMLLFLTAVISINLGIMNLLPIPGLDGSRAVFLLIEAIQKRPINPKREAFIHGLGLMFLLIVMVFVTYQDIIRILGEGGII